jgi:hypothetical protein
MFLLHFVICVAAYVVGWITTIGIGMFFQAVLGAGTATGASDNLFIVPGLPIAITNSIAASIACRKISSDGARRVWIPLVLLIYYNYTNYPPAQTLGQHLWNVWNQMFSPHCGSSECLGQFFLGIPFVGSIVYAITSMVVRRDDNEASPPSGVKA